MSRPSKKQTAIVAPPVHEVPFEGVSKLVADTGVDMQVLQRMLKIAAVVMQPGTGAEGDNASRSLDVLLRRHNLQRESVLKLAGGNEGGNIMQEAGRYSVTMPYKNRVNSDFTLVDGVCALFNVAYYYDTGADNIIFTFVGSSSLACSAATLFSGLYVESRTAWACSNQKKGPFLEGISDAFWERARELRSKRRKHLERLREEAEVARRVAEVKREADDVARSTASIEAEIKREAEVAREARAAEVAELVAELSDDEIYVDDYSEDEDDDGVYVDDDSEDEEVQEVQPTHVQAPQVIDLTGPDESRIALMQNERDDAVKSAAYAAIVFSKKRQRALLGYRNADSESYREGKKSATKLSTSTQLSA